jgi:hypothetical protein
MVQVWDGEGRQVVPSSGKAAKAPVDGEGSWPLPPGHYRVKVCHGLNFLPWEGEVDLSGEACVEVALSPWYDLPGHGWRTGEAHNHINFPVTPAQTAAYLSAVGMDCISLCQGWSAAPQTALGHDGPRLRAWLEGHSTREAHLYWGAEFPKTRFGHVCWWRFPDISDPFGCYDSYHDGDYFRQAGITAENVRHPAEKIPFRGEAPAQKVERWRRQGGVAMVPHPTSWWLENQAASLVCTNIASDLCFGLLAGGIYDVLVVMGYDAEQIFYQNLWFHLLNEGFSIPGCAETDGSLGGHHAIGSLRTYVQTGQPEFDREAFLGGLCAGHSFMTSGPILLATANGGALPGSVLRNDGGEARIQVQAWSHPDPGEHLSWLVLYRNGRLAELVDLEDRQPRAIEHEFRVRLEPGVREWFVVKAYGRKHPRTREDADIMAYAERCEGETDTFYASLDQVALTNPFFFTPEGWRGQETLTPPLSGTVADGDGQPIAEAVVTVLRQGEPVARAVTDADGRYHVPAMPLTGELEITASGYPRESRSLYLHYPPLVRYFESIYSGHWAFRNPSLKPGQVPWAVFQFRELRELLGELHWDFRLEANGHRRR